MGEPILLTLPEPPSSNRYWRRHGLTLHRSREANDYIKMVGLAAATLKRNGGPAFPTEEVSIIVIWHRSAKRGDLPNRTKVLYDALQGTLYTDDKQICQEWTRRVDQHPTVPKGCVQVEVCATDLV